jgi:RNA polymerase sigma-70 factor (ECF subfamily)
MDVMGTVEVVNKVEVFDQSRPKLFGIAYRMLGSRDDAEDTLQEAYIRWHKSDPEDIETPEAWLVTVVTRLSIDRLRKASHEREVYIGPWLPEPIVTEPSPEENAEFASDLSLAFLNMLERLSPTERAVFLLHDIFDLGYSDIARVVGKTEASARQIVHRARERVRKDKPRFETSEVEREQMIRKFVAASYAGDKETLLSLFADEVALTSDGGGIVNAARRTVYGAKRLANLYAVVVRKGMGHLTKRLVTVNGETGILEFVDSEPFAVTTLVIEDGKITAIYRVMNPNKLTAFAELSENIFEDDMSQTKDHTRLVN